MKNKQELPEVFEFGNKQYVLADEIVQGGCQGCAFYARMDCSKPLKGYVLSRANICNMEHKIFKRKLKSVKG